MKISCDIIKDLLPLYYDGVCSADSKAIIEAHLAQCAVSLFKCFNCAK